ncbi:hypothetical protein HDA40_003220 [Hamadaea flava]|uniref:Uncharacterized protein n=1 Tax=Hamadaea flava TaxID=1742688 RepID=A0ABV8LYB1_9ACTN|nr:hypothetical protein [Hamadaea flava]MCP2324713.1 hypothetical protein [Hamadaea flava]
MTNPEPESSQPPVAQPPQPVQPAQPVAPVVPPQPVAPAAENTMPLSPWTPPSQPAQPAYPAPAPAQQPTAAYPPVQQPPAAPAQPAYAQTTAQPAYQPGGATVPPAQPTVAGNPPTGYPTSAVPAQPVSGAAYPTSAYPATGAPYSAVPAGPPGPKKGPAVLILSILVGVLVLALGTVTTLYLVKASDASKQEKAAATQAATDAKDLADLKAQLTTTKGEAEKLKQDLEGAKNANAEKLKLLTACVDAVDKMMTSTTQAAFNKAFPAMRAACEAAQIATS